MTIDTFRADLRRFHFTEAQKTALCIFAQTTNFMDFIEKVDTDKTDIILEALHDEFVDQIAYVLEFDPLFGRTYDEYLDNSTLRVSPQILHILSGIIRDTFHPDTDELQTWGRDAICNAMVDYFGEVGAERDYDVFDHDDHFTLLDRYDALDPEDQLDMSIVAGLVYDVIDELTEEA